MTRRLRSNLIWAAVLLVATSWLWIPLVGGSIVYHSVPGAREKGRIARAQAELRAISLSLGSYRESTGSYPTTEQGLAALVSRPILNPPPGWQQQWTEIPIDPWGSSYAYRFPGKSEPAEFELFSLGADRTESDDDIRPPD